MDLRYRQLAAGSASPGGVPIHPNRGVCCEPVPLTIAAIFQRNNSARGNRKLSSAIASKQLPGRLPDCQYRGRPALRYSSCVIGGLTVGLRPYDAEDAHERRRRGRPWVSEETRCFARRR